VSTKQRAGQSIPEWCAEAGFSKITYYRLPLDRRPQTAQIGRRVLVVEGAADWLRRIAASGPVQLQRAAA